MDAIEALKSRRSVRDFETTPIPKEVLEDIIDCARLAATARNVQPWDFIVVTDMAQRRRIAEVADTGRFIADAPACVVVLCRDEKYYLEDGCAATQNILVAARAHGLGSCWVAGDKKPYADRLVQMIGGPKGHRLVSLVAIGRAESTAKPAKRPLTEVLHWQKF